MTKLHVSTLINGEPAEFLCEPYETMLDALRGPLGLTGSKEGCSSGDCGACSITLDDRLVCSCLMLAVEAAFDLSIPDADLTPENFKSVQALQNLVKRLKTG